MRDLSFSQARLNAHSEINEYFSPCREANSLSALDTYGSLLREARVEAVTWNFRSIFPSVYKMSL